MTTEPQPQRCPRPGCPREWVVDSIRKQCEDEGHVPAREAK